MAFRLAFQNCQHVFEFDAQLANDLLALVDVVLGIIARQALARAADGEAVLVQQAPDLADENDVLTLIRYGNLRPR